MKKILSVPILSVLALTVGYFQVCGQSSFSFGLTAGIASTGMTSHLANNGGGTSGYSYTGKSSIFLGLASNIRATDQIRIQPEFLLQLIGSRISETGYGHYSVDIAYFKVPIDVLYKVKAGPGDLQVGLGPYFAKALLGTADGQSMVFGNKAGDDDLRGGDFGLDLRAEYVFHFGFFLSLNYDDGLANVIPGGSSHGNDHTYCTGISIGMLFGYRQKK